MVTAEEQAKRNKSDLHELLARPAFLRFLFRTIQLSGMFDPTTDGSEARFLERQGRRNLGLDILAMVEEGQPVSHGQLPILTLIQTFREEANQPLQEKPNGRRADRYDADD